MSDRGSYSIPVNELGNGVRLPPGGLAANPKLHLANGYLHCFYDLPKRGAAYHQAPRRRMGYDQGAPSMPPRGSTSGGLSVDQLEDLTAWLKSKLSPADFAELQQMANGYGGDPNDNGGMDEPDADQARREQAQELEARRQATIGQDAAFRRMSFEERYPGASRMKSWAKF
jgi:hypothetical protein